MTITLAEVLPFVTAALGGGLGWLWRELATLRRDHANHRTHVAERYVTKDDMTMSLDRVYATLDRIEKKLDR